MSFEAFMEKQIDEINASGLDPELWIELHAAEFRAANPVDES